MICIITQEIIHFINLDPRRILDLGGRARELQTSLAPTDDSRRLRDRVRDVYSRIAAAPESDSPFPVGRKLALGVGYPDALLDSLPAISVEAFAGVAAVSVSAPIEEGMRVLDLGCGAGLDTLVAARRTGDHGRVTSVDFSVQMLARTRQAVEEADSDNVELVEAPAESMPFAERSFDAVLVNGLFNLNPERDRIFHELARVTKRGGVVYAAELILREPLPPALLRDESNWFT